MSAMSDLASHLVEFGGDIETHGGWIARRADGTTDWEGFRYARLERCRLESCPGRTCDACTWHYLGAAFSSDDAATRLLEVVGT